MLLDDYLAELLFLDGGEKAATWIPAPELSPVEILWNTLVPLFVAPLQYGIHAALSYPLVVGAVGLVSGILILPSCRRKAKKKEDFQNIEAYFEEWGPRQKSYSERDLLPSYRSSNHVIRTGSETNCKPNHDFPQPVMPQSKRRNQRRHDCPQLTIRPHPDPESESCPQLVSESENDLEIGEEYRQTGADISIERTSHAQQSYDRSQPVNFDRKRQQNDDSQPPVVSDSESNLKRSNGCQQPILMIDSETKSQMGGDCPEMVGPSYSECKSRHSSKIVSKTYEKTLQQSQKSQQHSQQVVSNSEGKLQENGDCTQIETIFSEWKSQGIYECSHQALINSQGKLQDNCDRTQYETSEWKSQNSCVCQQQGVTKSEGKLQENCDCTHVETIVSEWKSQKSYECPQHPVTHSKRKLQKNCDCTKRELIVSEREAQRSYECPQPAVTSCKGKSQDCTQREKVSSKRNSKWSMDRSKSVIMSYSDKSFKRNQASPQIVIRTGVENAHNEDKERIQKINISIRSLLSPASQSSIYLTAAGEHTQTNKVDTHMSDAINSSFQISDQENLAQSDNTNPKSRFGENIFLCANNLTKTQLGENQDANTNIIILKRSIFSKTNIQRDKDGSSTVESTPSSDIITISETRSTKMGKSFTLSQISENNPERNTEKQNKKANVGFSSPSCTSIFGAITTDIEKGLGINWRGTCKKKSPREKTGYHLYPMDDKSKCKYRRKTSQKKLSTLNDINTDMQRNIKHPLSRDENRSIKVESAPSSNKITKSETRSSKMGKSFTLSQNSDNTSECNIENQNKRLNIRCSSPLCRPVFGAMSSGIEKGHHIKWHEAGEKKLFRERAVCRMDGKSIIQWSEPEMKCQYRRKLAQRQLTTAHDIETDVHRNTNPILGDEIRFMKKRMAHIQRSRRRKSPCLSTASKSPNRSIPLRDNEILPGMKLDKTRCNLLEPTPRGHGNNVEKTHAIAKKSWANSRDTLQYILSPGEPEHMWNMQLKEDNKSGMLHNKAREKLLKASSKELCDALSNNKLYTSLIRNGKKHIKKVFETNNGILQQTGHYSCRDQIIFNPYKKHASAGKLHYQQWRGLEKLVSFDRRSEYHPVLSNENPWYGRDTFNHHFRQAALRRTNAMMSQCKNTDIFCSVGREAYFKGLHKEHKPVVKTTKEMSNTSEKECETFEGGAFISKSYKLPYQCKRSLRSFLDEKEAKVRKSRCYRSQLIEKDLVKNDVFPLEDAPKENMENKVSDGRHSPIKRPHKKPLYRASNRLDLSMKTTGRMSHSGGSQDSNSRIKKAKNSSSCISLGSYSRMIRNKISPSRAKYGSSSRISRNTISSSCVSQNSYSQINKDNKVYSGINNTIHSRIPSSRTKINSVITCNKHTDNNSEHTAVNESGVPITHTLKPNTKFKGIKKPTSRSLKTSNRLMTPEKIILNLTDLHGKPDKSEQRDNQVDPIATLLKLSSEYHEFSSRTSDNPSLGAWLTSKRRNEENKGVSVQEKRTTSPSKKSLNTKHKRVKPPRYPSSTNKLSKKKGEKSPTRSPPRSPKGKIKAKKGLKAKIRNQNLIPGAEVMACVKDHRNEVVASDNSPTNKHEPQKGSETIILKDSPVNGQSPRSIDVGRRSVYSSPTNKTNTYSLMSSPTYGLDKESNLSSPFKRQCSENSVSKGTVSKGTVSKGTVSKGTVSKGTVSNGAVSKGVLVTRCSNKRTYSGEMSGVDKKKRHKSPKALQFDKQSKMKEAEAAGRKHQATKKKVVTTDARKSKITNDRSQAIGQKTCASYIEVAADDITLSNPKHVRRRDAVLENIKRVRKHTKKRQSTAKKTNTITKSSDPLMSDKTPKSKHQRKVNKSNSMTKSSDQILSDKVLTSLNALRKETIASKNKMRPALPTRKDQSSKSKEKEMDANKRKENANATKDTLITEKSSDKKDTSTFPAENKPLQNNKSDDGQKPQQMKDLKGEAFSMTEYQIPSIPQYHDSYEKENVKGEFCKALKGYLKKTPKNVTNEQSVIELASMFIEGKDQSALSADMTPRGEGTNRKQKETTATHVHSVSDSISMELVAHGDGEELSLSKYDKTSCSFTNNESAQNTKLTCEIEIPAVEKRENENEIHTKDNTIKPTPMRCDNIVNVDKKKRISKIDSTNQVKKNKGGSKNVEKISQTVRKSNNKGIDGKTMCDLQTVEAKEIMDKDEDQNASTNRASQNKRMKKDNRPVFIEGNNPDSLSPKTEEQKGTTLSSSKPLYNHIERNESPTLEITSKASTYVNSGDAVHRIQSDFNAKHIIGKMIKKKHMTAPKTKTDPNVPKPNSTFTEGGEWFNQRSKDNIKNINKIGNKAFSKFLNGNGNELVTTTMSPALVANDSVDSLSRIIKEQHVSLTFSSSDEKCIENGEDAPQETSETFLDTLTNSQVTSLQRKVSKSHTLPIDESRSKHLADKQTPRVENKRMSSKPAVQNSSLSIEHSSIRNQTNSLECDKSTTTEKKGSKLLSNETPNIAHGESRSLKLSNTSPNINTVTGCTKTSQHSQKITDKMSPYSPRKPIRCTTEDRRSRGGFIPNGKLKQNKKLDHEKTALSKCTTAIEKCPSSQGFTVGKRCSGSKDVSEIESPSLLNWLKLKTNSDPIADNGVRTRARSTSHFESKSTSVGRLRMNRALLSSKCRQEEKLDQVRSTEKISHVGSNSLLNRKAICPRRPASKESSRRLTTTLDTEAQKVCRDTFVIERHSVLQDSSLERLNLEDNTILSEPENDFIMKKQPMLKHATEVETSILCNTNEMFPLTYSMTLKDTKAMNKTTSNINRFSVGNRLSSKEMVFVKNKSIFQEPTSRNITAETRSKKNETFLHQHVMKSEISKSDCKTRSDTPFCEPVERSLMEIDHTEVTFEKKHDDRSILRKPPVPLKHDSNRWDAEGHLYQQKVQQGQIQAKQTRKLASEIDKIRAHAINSSDDDTLGGRCILPRFFQTYANEEDSSRPRTDTMYTFVNEKDIARGKPYQHDQFKDDAPCINSARAFGAVQVLEISMNQMENQTCLTSVTIDSPLVENEDCTSPNSPCVPIESQPTQKSPRRYVRIESQPTHISPRRCVRIGSQPTHISPRSCVPIESQPTHISPRTCVRIESQPTHISPRRCVRIESQPTHISPLSCVRIESQPTHISPRKCVRIESQPTHISPRRYVRIESQPTHISPLSYVHIESQPTLISPCISHENGQERVSTEKSEMSKTYSTSTFAIASFEPVETCVMENNQTGVTIVKRHSDNSSISSKPSVQLKHDSNRFGVEDNMHQQRDQQNIIDAMQKTKQKCNVDKTRDQILNSPDGHVNEKQCILPHLFQTDTKGEDTLKPRMETVYAFITPTEEDTTRGISQQRQQLKDDTSSIISTRNQIENQPILTQVTLNPLVVDNQGCASSNSLCVRIKSQPTLISPRSSRENDQDRVSINKSEMSKTHSRSTFAIASFEPVETHGMGNNQTGVTIVKRHSDNNSISSTPSVPLKHDSNRLDFENTMLQQSQVNAKQTENTVQALNSPDDHINGGKCVLSQMFQTAVEIGDALKPLDTTKEKYMIRKTPQQRDQFIDDSNSIISIRASGVAHVPETAINQIEKQTSLTPGTINQPEADKQDCTLPNAACIHIKNQPTLVSQCNFSENGQDKVSTLTEWLEYKQTEINSDFGQSENIIPKILDTMKQKIINMQNSLFTIAIHQPVFNDDIYRKEDKIEHLNDKDRTPESTMKAEAQLCADDNTSFETIQNNPRSTDKDNLLETTNNETATSCGRDTCTLFEVTSDVNTTKDETNTIPKEDSRDFVNTLDNGEPNASKSMDKDTEIFTSNQEPNASKSTDRYVKKRTPSASKSMEKGINNLTPSQEPIASKSMDRNIKNRVSSQERIEHGAKHISIKMTKLKRDRDVNSEVASRSGETSSGELIQSYREKSMTPFFTHKSESEEVATPTNKKDNVYTATDIRNIREYTRHAHVDKAHNIKPAPPCSAENMSHSPCGVQHVSEHVAEGNIKAKQSTSSVGKTDQSRAAFENDTKRSQEKTRDGLKMSPNADVLCEYKKRNELEDDNLLFTPGHQDVQNDKNMSDLETTGDGDKMSEPLERTNSLSKVNDMFLNSRVQKLCEENQETSGSTDKDLEALLMSAISSTVYSLGRHRMKHFFGKKASIKRKRTRSHEMLKSPCEDRQLEHLRMSNLQDHKSWSCVRQQSSCSDVDDGINTGVDVNSPPCNKSHSIASELNKKRFIVIQGIKSANAWRESTKSPNLEGKEYLKSSLNALKRQCSRPENKGKSKNELGNVPSDAKIESSLSISKRQHIHPESEDKLKYESRKVPYNIKIRQCAHQERKDKFKDDPKKALISDKIKLSVIASKRPSIHTETKGKDKLKNDSGKNSFDTKFESFLRRKEKRVPHISRNSVKPNRKTHISSSTEVILSDNKHESLEDFLKMSEKGHNTSSSSQEQLATALEVTRERRNSIKLSPCQRPFRRSGSQPIMTSDRKTKSCLSPTGGCENKPIRCRSAYSTRSNAFNRILKREEYKSLSEKMSQLSKLISYDSKSPRTNPKIISLIRSRSHDSRSSARNSSVDSDDKSNLTWARDFALKISTSKSSVSKNYTNPFGSQRKSLSRSPPNILFSTTSSIRKGLFHPQMRRNSENIDSSHANKFEVLSPNQNFSKSPKNMTRISPRKGRMLETVYKVLGPGEKIKTSRSLPENMNINFAFLRAESPRTTYWHENKKWRNGTDIVLQSDDVRNHMISISEASSDIDLSWADSTLDDTLSWLTENVGNDNDNHKEISSGQDEEEGEIGNIKYSSCHLTNLDLDINSNMCSNSFNSSFTKSYVGNDLQEFLVRDFADDDNCAFSRTEISNGVHNKTRQSAVEKTNSVESDMYDFDDDSRQSTLNSIQSELFGAESSRGIRKGDVASRSSQLDWMRFEDQYAASNQYCETRKCSADAPPPPSGENPCSSNVSCSTQSRNKDRLSLEFEHKGEGSCGTSTTTTTVHDTGSDSSSGSITKTTRTNLLTWSQKYDQARLRDRSPWLKMATSYRQCQSEVDEKEIRRRYNLKRGKQQLAFNDDGDESESSNGGGGCGGGTFATNEPGVPEPSASRDTREAESYTIRRAATRQHQLEGDDTAEEGTSSVYKSNEMGLDWYKPHQAPAVASTSTHSMTAVSYRRRGGGGSNNLLTSHDHNHHHGNNNHLSDFQRQRPRPTPRLSKRKNP